MSRSAAGRGGARSVTRRGFLKLAGGGGVLLLTACSGGAPQPPAPVATSAPIVVPTQAAVVAPQPVAQASPAAAAPATAAPAQAAPTVARAEPKGKFVLGWHTAISPTWYDPLETVPQITPFNFAYALHDALVKHMPGKPFAPSLTESYEIAPDFKSATFKLRPGIKFHDGSPVTPEDVKFTFEQYRGAGAKLLKDKTAGIEAPDNRTVRFTFKEPFLDFLVLYGSPASGAGWIVPKAYYEKVGKDAFKTAPIGAGPYRFVKQQAGTELELEAFPDYWRKVPNVKTVIMKGVTEGATRVALLKTGDVDVANQIPGELLESVRTDPKMRILAGPAASTCLELLSLDAPDHPLKDVRVRQAVSLALDRKAINDAELGGTSQIEGNWIPAEWPGAVHRPVPPMDLARAKQLLTEAGVPNGFEVSQITPSPPFYSWAERVATQLRALNIVTRVNQLERGAFFDKMAPGPDRLKGIVLQFSAAPGDAASRIREAAVCKGTFSGICLPEVDDRMQRYDTSTDPAERKKLLDEVQTYLLDQYIMVPVCRNVFLVGTGPRLANSKPETFLGSIPQDIFVGPWEDVQVDG